MTTSYAVQGYAPMTPEQLALPVMKIKPETLQISPAIIEWANAYSELCPIAGINTLAAWAQALHESDYFLFTGRAQSFWNNPCGLGVGAAEIIQNGIPVPNSSDCQFPTRAVGCRAHLGHLIAYVDRNIGHALGFCNFDPRHVPHRGLVNDIRGLGGPGRWAPDPMYGVHIAALMDQLTS